MLVERVGDRTFLGEISDEVQTDTRESPLKLRLTRLAGQISRMGYLAAALVALIGVLGLVGLYLGLPDFPAADPVTALAVGIVSGLAATGINQMAKQLSK